MNEHGRVLYPNKLGVRTFSIFLDVDEKECLRRLLIRNQHKPEGLYFASTTETEFRAICKYLQAPTPEEGLTITTYSG